MVKAVQFYNHEKQLCILSVHGRMLQMDYQEQATLCSLYFYFEVVESKRA